MYTFVYLNGGVYLNNDFIIIKGKLDKDLNDALKKILIIKNITQQDFIENMVRDYVLKNLNLLLPKEDDKK